MIKVNEYFDGNVKSLSLNTPEGPATVGVMAMGEYEFGTSSKEIMKVISGAIAARLPGEDWKTFLEGESFIVEANQKFLVKVDADASYLCLYK